LSYDPVDDEALTMTTDLFDRLIDYAGVFPPAALDLPVAVEEYRALRAGDLAGMVGPLLVRSSQLDRLDASGADSDWPIGVVVDTPLASVVDEVADTARTVIQIELPAPDIATIVAAAPELARLPGAVRVFIEAAGEPIEDLVAAIATVPSALAKIRTGGTVAGSTIASDRLARFMAACVAHGLAWKPTAGLHQPIRHHEPTIGEDQHGFLNVLAATWATEHGASIDEAVAILQASDASAIVIPPPRVRQRMVALGSCSVREPADGLHALGLLPRWFDDVAIGSTLAGETSGRKVVVVRFASGRAQVFDRFCPHLGANLARLGVVKGETLQCKSHHWTYDCSGACVSAPTEDELPTERLASFPTREREGRIEAALP
jgi:nitrite reductase/ring-hydroxylating ferredoxin subunit